MIRIIIIITDKNKIVCTFFPDIEDTLLIIDLSTIGLNNK